MVVAIIKTVQFCLPKKTMWQFKWNLPSGLGEENCEGTSMLTILPLSSLGKGQMKIL